MELRDTISLRHVADPLLTNKDGKQDAKEDDDEKDELHDHGFSNGGVRRRLHTCAAGLLATTSPRRCQERLPGLTDALQCIIMRTMISRTVSLNVNLNLIRSGGAPG